MVARGLYVYGIVLCAIFLFCHLLALAGCRFSMNAQIAALIASGVGMPFGAFFGFAILRKLKKLGIETSREIGQTFIFKRCPAWMGWMWWGLFIYLLLLFGINLIVDTTRLGDAFWFVLCAGICLGLAACAKAYQTVEGHYKRDIHNK